MTCRASIIRFVAGIGVAAAMLFVAPGWSATASTPGSPALATVAGGSEVAVGPAGDVGIDSCTWGSSSPSIFVRSCRLVVTAALRTLPGFYQCAPGFFRMWNAYDYNQARVSYTATFCINQQVNLGPAFSNRSCATFYFRQPDGIFREHGSAACNTD